MVRILAEYEAELFLKKYVPVAQSFLAKDFSEASKAARKLRFPVVLKIISKDALHKTEIGGVKIVRDLDDLKKSFSDLVNISRKRKMTLEGILIQEHVNGIETIIGIKNDSTFGHVIMFGTGGTAVELLKDVSFRVCPITDKDAQSMIDDLKMKQLLYGFRGKKTNIKLLKKTLVEVSKIPHENKNLQELDINPFIINEKSGKVADARISFA